MPRYRVRSGEVLACNGTILEAGSFVELPRVVAEDMANRHLVEEVDAAGNPVTPVPSDGLERFRSHERVGILQDRLREAQARVVQIQAQLTREEQILRDAVQAALIPDEPKAAPAKRAVTQKE